MLNTVLSGQAVTQVRDDIYLVNVVARADEERVSLESLAAPGARAAERTVPLSQIAGFADQDYPAIWRRDQVPTLTVQADVRQGVLPGVVGWARSTRSARPHCPATSMWAARWRAPPRLLTVVAVVPVMLLLMFTVLMFQS